MGLTTMTRATAIAAAAALAVSAAGASAGSASERVNIVVSQGFRSVMTSIDVAGTALLDQASSRRGRGWRFSPYGPVGVQGPEVSSAYGFGAPPDDRACGGMIWSGGDPYRGVVWIGTFRQAISCRLGRAALIASVRWKRGTLRLGASDCAPVVVDNALQPSCRVRLSTPAGWSCEFRSGDEPTYWPVTCSGHGASLIAAWASPPVGTQIVWGPSDTGPLARPLYSFPSLAVWTGEVDAVTIHRARGPHHRWLWGYEVYPFQIHQYVVIGVARSCGVSAGATEARMRSVHADRLYFAQTYKSALGDKTRYIPLPPEGRYVVCDFFQRGPADSVAVLAGQERFRVPDTSPREPEPAPSSAVGRAGGRDF